MKKIVNGNSGCNNCINSNVNVNKGCDAFINKMIANGLEDCVNSRLGNYIYSEKENTMKLTKEEKKELKAMKAELFEQMGFIAIFNNGITRVYSPVTTYDDNRMFDYGQSVCNKSDEYNRKRGIYLALIDLGYNNPIPKELVYSEVNNAEIIDC